jgi:MFS family permease
MLAYLASNIPAGVLADRLRRRTVLVLSDLVRAAAILVIGFGLAFGQVLPVLLLIAVGTVDTVVSSVAGPAGTATLRYLVPSDELPRALALDSSSALTLGLVGPLVGAVLFQVAPALPFLVDGVSYGVSLAFVMSVRRGLGGGTPTALTLRQDIAVGMRFVVRSPFILTYMIWAALINFGTAGMAFGLVVVIGPANSGQLGIAMTVLTVAAVAGSSIAPRLRRCGQRALVQASTASSVAVGVVIAIFPDPVVITACIAARSLFAPAAGIHFNARVFAMVPDEMTARVQSSLYLIGGALSPFATLASGWLCQRYSPSTAFASMAAILAVVLMLTFLPVMRTTSVAPLAGLDPG